MKATTVTVNLTSGEVPLSSLPEQSYSGKPFSPSTGWMDLFNFGANGCWIIFGAGLTATVEGADCIHLPAGKALTVRPSTFSAIAVGGSTKLNIVGIADDDLPPWMLRR